MKTLNVAIIGYKFMGRAHSNAWLKAPLFFDVNVKPVLKVACGRHAGSLKAFAEKWGWEEVETDWREVVNRSDVDIVDISAPTYLHHPIAIEAAQAGKHIFCEKPIALTSQQAREMYQAAERNGVVHYLNHNYRRNPAVMLAKRLIDEGKKAFAPSSPPSLNTPTWRAGGRRGTSSATSTGSFTPWWIS